MSVVTRWPTAVDYQTAIQTPALCFNDPALKQGTVYTDALGLPAAATGNVVVVFRMRLEKEDVALRCFTRKVPLDPLVERYRVLNQYLTRVDLPVLVPTIYRPDEILIDDQWYPVIQMPWLPGVPLNCYIEDHLHDAEALDRLAVRWRSLMTQLYAAHFAHGDLSDGNVLVDEQGQIYLIDYDAAYIPDLKYDPPSEVGKPNYQHPERLAVAGAKYGYYGSNVDAFGALVIYLSLRALADDASRWRCYHTGENLIFDQEDFVNPGYTPIWLDLRNSKREEIKQLCEVLEGFCQGSVSDLPDLERAMQGRIPPRQRRQADVQPAEEKTPIPSSPQAGVAVDHDVQAYLEETERPLAWLRLPHLVGVAGVAVLTLLLVLFFRGSKNEARGSVSLSPPSEMTMGYAPPQALPGFYTGYATSLDGKREPMALMIDSLEVFPDLREAFFSYTVNWKAHYVGGVGRYNMDTGHVDLESHYVLYVARATDDEVVLASLSHRAQRPLVQVNKRLTQ